MLYCCFMKKLIPAVFLFFTINVSAFWGNNNWSPFGNNTGYYNNAPWGSSSNWNPFSSGDSFNPMYDAKNMSLYGVDPRHLGPYNTKNDAYYLIQNQTRPSNWLQETDFASTLDKTNNQVDKGFIVDELKAFGLSDGYARAKAESLGFERALHSYRTNTRGSEKTHTEGVYGKQGYGLSPAASSTNKIQTH